MFKTRLEEEIEEFYRSVYRNLIAKDMEELDGVFDDDFVISHVWGDEESKDEFLETVEKESLRFYSENIERVYIDKNEETLNVRGRSLVNTSRDGSRRRIRRVQVDFELAKTDDDSWKVLNAKVSLY